MSRFIYPLLYLLLAYSWTATAASVTRDYQKPLAPEEIADIHYVVSSLGRNSMARLLFQQGKLERAGERIEHIHPLRFLLVILGSEELKAAFHAIRGKSLLWSRFGSNLNRSFQEEASKDNLLPLFWEDFSGQLGLSSESLRPFQLRGDWRGLVDYLLQALPRQGDYRRYDL